MSVARGGGRILSAEEIQWQVRSALWTEWNAGGTPSQSDSLGSKEVDQALKVSLYYHSNHFRSVFGVYLAPCVGSAVRAGWGRLWTE